MIFHNQVAPPWVLGFYFKVISKSYQEWAIFAPTVHDDSNALAKLLALGIIDNTTNVVTPGFMPRRPAEATLRDDGTFRHSVTRPFEPWILSEIDRITPSILDFSSALLTEMENMDGAKRMILRPSPPDSPFTKGPGVEFELELPNVAINHTEHSTEREKHSRDAIVKQEYKQNRFMAHLPRTCLDDRAVGVFNNTYQIDKYGRIKLEPNDPRTYYWQDRFSEVLQEYAERGIPMEDYAQYLANDKDLNRGLDGAFRKAGKITGSFTAPPNPYIVKYGSYPHMLDLQKNGQVRIAAAQSYNDASLNPARRDEEMRREVDWDSSILPYSLPGGTPSYVANPKPLRLSSTLSIDTNYYVFCVSETLRARLFNDFEANAALVINNPSEFESRLRAALASHCPTWTFDSDRVEYFDPLNVSPYDVKLPFWKDFAYAYQEEIRFTLYPPKPTGHLSPLFLDIGSLEDISELAVLDWGAKG